MILEKSFLTLIGQGFWMLLVCRGGGLDHPTPSRWTLWKTKFFFDFQKAHNEIGKVTIFGTSRPLFSWRKDVWKKCPALLGLTLFGFRVRVIPGINPTYGKMDRPCSNDSKTYVIHKQRDKQSDIKNRVQREQSAWEIKLVISFNPIPVTCLLEQSKPGNEQD